MYIEEIGQGTENLEGAKSHQILKEGKCTAGRKPSKLLPLQKTTTAKHDGSSRLPESKPKKHNVKQL